MMQVSLPAAPKIVQTGTVLLVSIKIVLGMISW